MKINIPEGKHDETINMRIWNKDEVVSIARQIKVDEHVIDEFAKTTEHFRTDESFPFYLEKCEEEKMETTAVKFFILRGIALLEWRKFGIIENQLKSTEAFRQIYTLDDIELLKCKGLSWRLGLKMSIPFNLEKALEGDNTYFERAY